MFEYMDIQQPRLVLGVVDVADLADREGTPLYVYDAAIVRRKCAKLQDALGSIELLYSIKANPNPRLCRLLADLGCGAEVASGGELEVALAAGIGPSRIVYAGPVKTDAEIAAGVKAGILAFAAESPRELERLERISSDAGLGAKALLRISTSGPQGNGNEIVLGGAKFGVDEEQAAALYSGFKPHNVEIVGIHHFGLSNSLSAHTILDSIEHTLQIGQRIFSELGLPPQIVDLGGGIGIPYSEGQSEIDLGYLKSELGSLLSRDDERKGLKYLWESGRYLVGECGVYLCRVLDVKESRGRRFLLTDGGIHHFARGLITGVQHPIRLANKLNEARTETYDIGGPICNPFDYLGRSIKLPPAQVGDLVCVFQAGAYGKTMSPLAFLSRPEPKEIVLDAGRVTS
jgi:diaminopimelate decarboxylase